MYRLGMFTGKIYDEIEKFNMEECGVIVSSRDLTNSRLINSMRRENTRHCSYCHYRCPEGRAGAVVVK